MFRNYGKLALKVLARHPFFTFISLFGISFTLMILMLITAFMEAEMGSHPPLSDKDRMVFLNRIELRYYRTDTLRVVDSALVSGQWRYDTTEQYVRNPESTSTSSPSLHFIERHLPTISPATARALYSVPRDFDLFVNHRKLSLSAIYTDADYWRIFDFEFIAGQPYSGGEVRDQHRVVVMTDRAARQYFGTDKEVVGRQVDLDGSGYTLIGLVKRARSSHDFVQADLFLPYTHIPAAATAGNSFMGSIHAVYLAPTAGARAAVQAEIQRQTALVPIADIHPQYNDLQTRPVTFNEYYAQGILALPDPAESLRWAWLILGLLLGFFVLLPTLNLVNLNISRILERSAEIGVRKAFGAHGGSILLQFIFENIIITFLGGAIGCTLALLLLYVINTSQVLPDTVLRFNGWVACYSIFVCLGFGIISGLLPAWKMSRLQIAESLKTNAV